MWASRNLLWSADLNDLKTTKILKDSIQANLAGLSKCENIQNSFF